MVEHLRQQAADIDGVRGGYKRALVQLGVGKGLLHQALAIIKRAANFESGDIFAEGSELFFLRFADALGGVENHHANSGYAEKAVRDGAAGIAGRGHKNGQRPRLGANEIAHQAGHETRAKILEGQRGAVKKLEDMQSW